MDELEAAEEILKGGWEECSCHGRLRINACGICGGSGRRHRDRYIEAASILGLDVGAHVFAQSLESWEIELKAEGETLVINNTMTLKMPIEFITIKLEI